METLETSLPSKPRRVIVATEDTDLHDDRESMDFPPTSTAMRAQANQATSESELEISNSQPTASGIYLASKRDLQMPAEKFAAGCNLLQVSPDIP